MSEDIEPSPAAAVSAGFWRRVAARIIDMLLLLPLTLALVFATGSSRELSIMADVLGLFLTQAYVVVSLYLWSQTAGKMILGVRVVSTSGHRLTALQAILRSSVEFGFATLIVVFTALAKLSISRAEFASESFLERARRIADSAPQLQAINTLNGFWFFGSVLVMLYSLHKRAPHDFLAGTRVVRVEALPGGGGSSPN